MDEALALWSHAAKSGAHAISSLPPLSGRLPFSDVLLHYESLARGSDLPLLVYYFPEISQSITSTEQLVIECDSPAVLSMLDPGESTCLSQQSPAMGARSGVVA
jgi:N-acetylneuraminate lyase